MIDFHLNIICHFIAHNRIIISYQIHYFAGKCNKGVFRTQRLTQNVEYKYWKFIAR